MTQDSSCWMADKILCCLFIIYYSCSTIQSFHCAWHNTENGFQVNGMQCRSNIDSQRNQIHWWNRVTADICAAHVCVFSHMCVSHA